MGTQQKVWLGSFVSHYLCVFFYLCDRAFIQNKLPKKEFCFEGIAKASLSVGLCPVWKSCSRSPVVVSSRHIMVK